MNLELEFIEKVLDMMRSKNVSELTYDNLSVKMSEESVDNADMSHEALAELEKYSKVPSDDEILMDPFTGLQEGG